MRSSSCLASASSCPAYTQQTKVLTCLGLGDYTAAAAAAVLEAGNPFLNTTKFVLI
jgi:hypothetical protein